MKDETLKKVIALCERADETETQIIIRALNRAADVRRHLRERESLSTIKVGDIVRIRSAKPKYLIGTKALVVEVHHADRKFKIEFLPGTDPRAIRRWGHKVTCPASMIERREGDN